MSDLKTTWAASWAHLKNWQGSSGLPVLPPLAALVELSVLVGVIVLIDWAFPAFDFSSVEPSPFWVPVLLLSLQYGTVAGLIAAAVSTAAYVFNGVADQAIGENFFTYLLRIWALPILWTGVALVLGQFRLRQIAEKEQLRQSLAKRTDEADRLAHYSKDLEARCHRLERQLTTRSAAPVKPVLDALSTMAAQPADIAVALAAVTNSLWPGAQISVSEITPNGCDVIANSGWPAAASWASGISAAHPLYRAIAGERRAVSVLNRGDEAVLAGHGLAAAPILSADGERVAGMLKIEMIDPDYLDYKTPSHLALIAQLLSRALTGAGVAGSAVASQTAWETTGVTLLRHNWKSPNGAAHTGGSPTPGDAAEATGEAAPSLWPRRSR